MSIELKDRYRRSYKEDIRKQRTCPSISLTKAGKGEAKKEKKKENQPLSKSHNPHEARSEKSKPFDIIPGMPHPMLISLACHNISLLKSLTKLDMSTAYENIPANLSFNSLESTRKTLVHRCSQFIPVQVYTRVLAANLFERGLEFPPRLFPQHYRTISKSYEARGITSQ